jgi:glycosyltransferase involved in cell wall biosynthesis
MNIVIDGRTATPHFPGIGRYVTNLVRSMAGAETDMSVSLIQDPSAASPDPALTSIPCALSPFSLRQQWVVPGLLKKNRAALYHSPYYLMPYHLPVPTVLTCYDVIPLIFFPQYFTSWQKVIYRIANKLAFRAASKVIAISETTRRDAIRFFGIEPDRIRAIPLGVDSRFTASPGPAIEAARNKYGLPDQYVLYVGTNKPHKNLVRLVEAWGIFHRETTSRHALVIAGYWDKRYPEARQLAERADLSGSVFFAGPVDEADLPALYSGATLFVFPSLYEGFGLPVLEAMACGTPVACGRTDALIEVAGDAASLFDPVDSMAMADCLADLLSDPDKLQRLGEAGIKRAAGFSWERTAAATWEVYHHVR